MIGKSSNKITISGGGYVGMATACMLSTKNHVTVFDVDTDRVKCINNRLSPIEDPDIKEWLSGKKDIAIEATADKEAAYLNADIVLIAVPTDFDEDSNSFDTSSVEQTIKDSITYNSHALIVIRSTVPIGFTERMREETGYKRILFSPEFLREGQALRDILYPTRIIAGTDLRDQELVSESEQYIEVVRQCSAEKDCPTQIMNSSDAEAVKLFSNAYLAARIAFFNELDSLAEARGLNPKAIITGMGYDSRIGDYYNNPGFGYGGYCLPKDTKQLLSEFDGVQQTLFTAIVESNRKRAEHVREQILTLADRLSNESSSESISIGIYRLNMKKDSDNYRQSAMLEIIRGITDKGYEIRVFEPLLDESPDDIPAGCVVENNLEQFKRKCHVIVANRFDSHLEDVKEKVYTRDLFQNN